MKDVYVFIDGIMIEAEPDESIRPKREVVGTDDGSIGKILKVTRADGLVLAGDIVR